MDQDRQQITQAQHEARPAGMIFLIGSLCKAVEGTHESRKAEMCKNKQQCIYKRDDRPRRQEIRHARTKNFHISRNHLVRSLPRDVHHCRKTRSDRRGGSYSVYVRDLDVQGEGSLKIAFENLRKKLEAEGLFDPALKRTIPAFPKRIGVLTSPTGAAVHDVITTVKRRNPLVNVLVYPCLVQGDGAAASIAEGLSEMNRLFPDLDVIIAGRGGGSAEDLWSFNEEIVARAIRASKIPVISAVGHEVDVTIADYAADLRGATPTAAAELAVPHMAALIDTLSFYTPERLYANLKSGFENYGLKLQRLMESADGSIRSLLQQAESRLSQLKTDADLSNPKNVLQRGYAMVQGEDGSWIESAGRLQPGQPLTLQFADGTALVTVQEVNAHERREN